jgi:hypothetical protein
MKADLCSRIDFGSEKRPSSWILLYSGGCLCVSCGLVAPKEEMERSGKQKEKVQDRHRASIH